MKCMRIQLKKQVENTIIKLIEDYLEKPDEVVIEKIEE